ncbi:molybdenum cofactor guanylyltransferase [Agreia bicolorata]|uniref:MobA-like NTP transferase domain-containing protein n=1 Tax=Agreia bicolorata TaxID=110935 RepID=A0ABR5CGR8_9MICO|nr:NTP transferase domain-containing protein [Agreia bicolorata]KJC64817.1 hypothetical protein TZ00_03860 [Agreia bicolorata]
MLLDAIVLAGGRSSRLSGEPKAQLLWHGATLLQNTVGASLQVGARRVVVVGPDAPDAPGRDARVRFTREDPPFGGPAAAIGAGMRALDEQQSPAADVVLVLACDMPEVARAVSALAESLPLAGSDGVLLLDSSGMRQPLAAVYGRPALADAVAGLRASGTLDGASMRALISSLDLRELADTAGSTRDVDTWADAADFGIVNAEHTPSTDEQRSRT